MHGYVLGGRKLEVLHAFVYGIPLTVRLEAVVGAQKASTLKVGDGTSLDSRVPSHHCHERRFVNSFPCCDMTRFFTSLAFSIPDIRLLDPRPNRFFFNEY